ncbi:MAG: LON peptidase substrate-binding domain-containing protein [Ilumatobacteraceae bacterium]
MSVLPMFPLGATLLPGSFLPLQIFEPRYQALLRDCLAGEPEFGVVMIEQGQEVGGGDHRRDVGTVARILQVGEIGPGLYAVQAVGARRIRVNAWLPDDPYPLADVDDWPDEACDAGRPLGARRASVEQEVRRVLASDRARHLAPDATAEISGDPLLASGTTAAIAPIGAFDRHSQLLLLQRVCQRLERLSAMLAMSRPCCDSGSVIRRPPGHAQDCRTCRAAILPPDRTPGRRCPDPRQGFVRQRRSGSLLGRALDRLRCRRSDHVRPRRVLLRARHPAVVPDRDGSTFGGNMSILPHVFALLFCLIVMALAVSRIKKTTLQKESRR